MLVNGQDCSFTIIKYERGENRNVKEKFISNRNYNIGFDFYE